MIEFLPSPSVRLLEEAADELGRLDALAQLAPAAFAHAARAAVIARLEGSPSGLVALVAAGVDPVHAATLSPTLESWARIVDDEVRRVRSGSPLSAKRFASYIERRSDSEHPPGHNLEHEGQNPASQRALRDPDALDAALRSSGEVRSVLLRGVSAAAAVGAGPLSELVPALLFCATGHLDRPWILPFADADPAIRHEALTEWAGNDPVPLLDTLLSACSTSSRAQRLAVRRLLQAAPAEEEALSTLGRAAITARRALAALRESLAITMPGLAERLECSRPAAGDALERLSDLGLAREITGRERDRVFAHAATWDVVA